MHDEEVQFCAFDVLVEGDEDLRKLPLHCGKPTSSAFAGAPAGGSLRQPIERGEIGPDLFRAARDMGLEGLVSKRRNRPGKGGRSMH
jgi:bifunctional non-homologous end joining protein LigD